MGRTVYYDHSGNEVEPPKADAVKQTNADRIRAMTDEELAYFMANIEPCRESAWLDWLKQEANDDNDDH